MIIIGDRARTLEVSTQALSFTPSEDSSEPPAQAWAPLTSDKYEDIEKRLMGKLEMRLQSTDERIANLEQAPTSAPKSKLSTTRWNNKWNSL